MTRSKLLEKIKEVALEANNSVRKKKGQKNPVIINPDAETLPPQR